jgi:hypothetical protein
VRSNAPLVGRLIAWVRRNVTSHLREPYLDPTLERQVAFNRQLIQVLQDYMEQTARQLEHGEAQRKILTEQMEQIKTTVTRTLEEMAASGALTAEAQQQLQALLRSLKPDPKSSSR